jgi:hypothetical protein
MCESCANGGDPLAAWLVGVSSPGQEQLSPESQLAAIPWLEAQKNSCLFLWASARLGMCLSSRAISFFRLSRYQNAPFLQPAESQVNINGGLSADPPKRPRFGILPLLNSWLNFPRWVI